MATPNLGLETIQLSDNMQTSLIEKMNGNISKIDSAYKQLKDLLLEKTGKDNLMDAINYVEKLVNAQDATITADKIFKGYTGYKGLEKITGTALPTKTDLTEEFALTGLKFYDNEGTLHTGTMTDLSNRSRAGNASVSGDNYRLAIPTTGYYDTKSYLTRPKTSVLSDLGVIPMPTINVTCDASTSYISDYGAGINNEGVLVMWAMTASTTYEHVYFYPSSIGIGTKGVGWEIISWDTSDPLACYACTVTGLSGYSAINVNLKYNSVNSSYDYTRLDVTITGS